ncbi:MAG: class II aldolase/adducin family protein [Clostridia bacterium]|nr:class II aldolase/adducin family protein [Clostridia bacterium]
MKYEVIRQQVLDAILEATSLGLIHGTSGNIAVRDFKENVIAITPSGRPYDTMKAEDIAIVTPEGEWIDGPYKPSSETPMHTAVFRARPDVGATVHNHAMYCTVMAMACDELIPTTPPQAEFSPVRVVPFEMPGTKALADHVVNTLGQGRAVLLKNHGSFCCGKDIGSAMAAAIYTEESAQAAYYASLLGKFEPLPRNVIDDIQAMIAADKAV